VIAVLNDWLGWADLSVAVWDGGRACLCTLQHVRRMWLCSIAMVVLRHGHFGTLLGQLR
jgi:hypothetical protein